MRTAIALCLLLVALCARSQERPLPIQRFYTQELLRSALRSDTLHHLGARPFLMRRFDLSTVPGIAKDSVKYYYKFTRVLFRDHLVQVSSGDFSLTIDPLFDFTFYGELADTSAYADSVRMRTNTRGLLIQGQIGDKVGFVTGFYENQAFLPGYLRDFTLATGVVPGMGRTKVFETSGFDYSMSFGSLNIAVHPQASVEMGYGKQFIGFGYRSLFVSDAAYVYPYLRGSVWSRNGKWAYTTSYAALQSLERLPLGEVPEALFRRKGATMHYLSFTPHPSFEVGIFEGTVFQRWDTTGVQALPWSAYVPVVGVNTAVGGFAGKQNGLIGVQSRVTFAHKVMVYGQFVADDPEVGALGFQAGARAFDFPLRGFDLQAEWNRTGDHLYGNHQVLQAFDHFNQPLGHPAGGDMDEYVGIIEYRYGRWTASVKYNQLRQQTGPTANWQWPTNSAYPAIVHPERRVQQWEARAGYLLNPSANARISVGYTDRIDRLDGIIHRHSALLFVSFATNIHERYADF